MNAVGGDLPGPEGDDLVTTSLAMARRLASGGTLWCAAPASPLRAEKMAAEVGRPVTAGGPSLRTVAVPSGRPGGEPEGSGPPGRLVAPRDQCRRRVGPRAARAGGGLGGADRLGRHRPQAGAGGRRLRPLRRGDRTFGPGPARRPLHATRRAVSGSVSVTANLLQATPDRLRATRSASPARTRVVSARWSAVGASAPKPRSALPPASRPWTRASSRTSGRTTSCSSMPAPRCRRVARQAPLAAKSEQSQHADRRGAAARHSHEPGGTLTTDDPGQGGAKSPASSAIDTPPAPARAEAGREAAVLERIEAFRRRRPRFRGRLCDPRPTAQAARRRPRS